MPVFLRESVGNSAIAAPRSASSTVDPSPNGPESVALSLDLGDHADEPGDEAMGYGLTMVVRTNMR